MEPGLRGQLLTLAQSSVRRAVEDRKDAVFPAARSEIDLMMQAKSLRPDFGLVVDAIASEVHAADPTKSQDEWKVRLLEPYLDGAVKAIALDDSEANRSRLLLLQNAMPDNEAGRQEVMDSALAVVQLDAQRAKAQSDARPILDAFQNPELEGVTLPESQETTDVAYRSLRDRGESIPRIGAFLASHNLPMQGDFERDFDALIATRSQQSLDEALRTVEGVSITNPGAAAALVEGSEVATIMHDLAFASTGAFRQSVLKTLSDTNTPQRLEDAKKVIGGLVGADSGNVMYSRDLPNVENVRWDATSMREFDSHFQYAWLLDPPQVINDDASVERVRKRAAENFGQQHMAVEHADGTKSIVRPSRLIPSEATKPYLDTLLARERTTGLIAQHNEAFPYRNTIVTPLTDPDFGDPLAYELFIPENAQFQQTVGPQDELFDQLAGISKLDPVSTSAFAQFRWESGSRNMAAMDAVLPLQSRKSTRLYNAVAQTFQRLGFLNGMDRDMADQFVRMQTRIIGRRLGWEAVFDPTPTETEE